MEQRRAEIAEILARAALRVLRKQPDKGLEDDGGSSAHGDQRAESS
jgi:hypothetical protein